MLGAHELLSRNHPIRRWPLAQSLTLLAAVLAVILFGGFLIFATGPDSEPDSSGSGAAGLQGASTLLPSPTFMSTVPILPSPTTTPTLVSPTAPFLLPTSTPILPTVAPPGQAGQAGQPENLFDLSLPPYQDQPQPLTIGEMVSGSLDQEQPRYVYAFAGQAGDLLLLSVTSDGPVGISHHVLNRPQIGNVSGSGGGGGGGSGGSAGSTEMTIPIELKVDSAVWVTVEYWGRDVNYTLLLNRQEVISMDYGETIETQLPQGIAFRYFEFVGARGDIITVNVDSSADTMMQMELDGQVLVTDDDGGANLNPEIYDYQLPVDAAYRLRVERVDPSPWTDGIDFSLSLSSKAPQTLDNGESTAILTAKQRAAVLTFEANAGETVRLSAVTDQTPVLISLVVAQRTQVLTTLDLFPPPSGAVGPDTRAVSRQFTVPDRGTVKVFVNMPDMPGVERPPTVSLPVTLTLERDVNQD